MRCKLGDIAVITRGMNVGKLVSVDQFLGNAPVRWGDGIWDQKSTGPMWLVTALGSPLKTLKGREFERAPVLDAILRPLRDNPWRDQTHFWRRFPREQRA